MKLVRYSTMGLRLRRRNAIYFILLAGLLAIIWASYQSFDQTAARAEKPLSDLLTALDGKHVAKGVFTTDGDRVDWTYTQGGRYRTFLPAGYSTVLVDKFHESQLPVDVAQSPASNVWLAVVLPNVILLLTIGGFLWYVLRRQRGRGNPIRV
jgi:ATP-dependent Zn protease